VKPGKVDHDEIERGNPEPASIVERRNILKSGLATTIVFAGGTVLSVISCLREIFSPSDDTSESS
jgi:hypothetical protein